MKALYVVVLIILSFVFGFKVGNTPFSAPVVFTPDVAPTKQETIISKEEIEPIRTIVKPDTTTVQVTTNPDTEALIKTLWAKIHDMETHLGTQGGQIDQWLSLISPGQRPDPKVLQLMGEYLKPYPVTLLYEEGLWLAERIKQDDWLIWGETIDDAIFTYLGENRLRRELTPEQFEACKP